ncbi:MAG: class I SAM-dependent methyltransferase [Pseudomonadota bacterium]|nr:class I SAM-dependent methyltransferase [Pseudomonadota bacterium]
MDNESRILDSWNRNAEPWIDAVRNRGIRAAGTASRDAIMAAIQSHAKPGATVLDVGCGEGWLAQLLSETGYRVTGVDASPALIDHARRHAHAQFLVGDLANLPALALGRFDLVVCNFSLFGEDSVRRFILSLPTLLIEGGTCLIQTLHPLAFFQGGDYRSQWCEGTWAGLPGDFSEPAPWYFRTMADWSALFLEAGCRMVEIREVGAEAGKVETIVFVISAS